MHDWIFVVSGSDTDGSFVSIFRNKTVDEMKEHIVNCVDEISQSNYCFDFGTEDVEDVEERFADDELVSLYGYASYADGHKDYEAHIMNKVKVFE